MTTDTELHCLLSLSPVPYRPRGFSIGISAASPGFEIRPSAAPRRSRLSLDGSTANPQRNELLIPQLGGRSTSSLPPPALGAAQSHASPLDMAPPELRDSPSCKRSPHPPDTDNGAHGRNRRTHHHHRRNDSLTGSPYVGPPPPPPPPPHSHVINLSTDRTPSPRDADNDGLGAAPEGQFARDGRWWWQR